MRRGGKLGVPKRQRDKPRGSRKTASTDGAAGAKMTVGPARSRDEPSAPTNQAAAHRIPIVAVGASAGGLEAFSELLRYLPARTGMAFVFVQHLDLTHGSMLRDLLARASSMPVEDAQHGRCLERDHVYVIQPNTDLALEDGVLKVTTRTEIRGQHMPIDFFFRALAEDQGSYAIGVVLSGTASDGAQGLAAIKAEGGITFAQDEKSAKYGGMPHAAVSTAGVDFVLPPNEIARELARIAGDPEALRTDRPVLQDEEDEALARILAILRKSMGIDLSYYKRPNLLRRIQRRCLLQQVSGLGEYVRYLHDHPAEICALHYYILINVTSFFRDGHGLEGLTKHVFPAILKARRRDIPIRIWVPGCATGEEPYTLAIELVEYLEQTSANTPIQIFATDVSERAIESARTGAYLEAIAADVAPERLRRYFTKVHRGYQVNKRIRDLCVFAKHNLVSDPPFSQLDLISCCNVLIYLRQEYQRRLMELFHYALRPSGFLKLGRSETIGASPELFTAVDKTHKIYAKKLVAARPPPPFTVRAATEAARGDAGGPAPPVTWGLADLQQAADRLVMAKYAPAGVLINEDMTIMQFRGRTGPFIEPAPGDASLNLLKMAREHLVLDLRTAIHQARRDNRPVRKDGLTTDDGGQTRTFSVEVVPIESPTASGRHFLVLFEDVPAAPEAPRRVRGRAEKPSARARMERRELTRLQNELATTKDHLSAIIEELEAANEELKSANEETLSSNEELQSTNEELETAKEELQSINEELTTVNEQLQVRNVELSQIANDLNNLLSSVNMPIVMVSSDLRIRRATPAATRVLNLLPADVGRPITDLNLDLGVPDLRSMLVEVIDAVAVREFDVRDRTGRRYVLRVQPYRTHENKIDGAVMVLVDVDELKHSVEVAEAAQRRLRHIQEITDAALADLPLETLLHELLVRVQKSLEVDTASILLREQDSSGPTNFLRARATVGLEEEVRRQIRVPIGQGFAGSIAAERKAIVLEKVNYDRVYSPWIREKGIKSLAGVPLQTEGRLIGVLHVGSLQQRHFEDDEVQLLHLGGDRIARAVERTESRDTDRRGREAAEGANQAKDDFLAVLSHELRTPLNAMVSWLGVLKRRGGTSEQIGHAVATLERNVWQQSRLINDLLDVSRIISGKLDLDIERVDMVEVVRSCVQEMRPDAESKGIALSANEIGCPCIVRGDAARLSQMIGNVLSNAIKFTPRGGRIEITTERTEQQVTIKVADTGEGIAAEFLPYVFDRFRQADNSTTRRHGGLGLGLAIARHLVERLGGTIEAGSAGSTQGATFVISLPREESGTVDAPKRLAAAPDLQQGEPLDLSVLLVDDDADTCEAMSVMLGESGAEVSIARSVSEALEIVAAAPVGVVISDISMPLRDGYALVQRIRQLDTERGARTIAIAMTGMAGQGNRAKALAAGFDEHLAKPVDPRTLIAMIRSLIQAHD